MVIADMVLGEEVPFSLDACLENLTDLDAVDDFGYTLVHYATQIGSLVA
jgi:hypothetical protein